MTDETNNNNTNDNNDDRKKREEARRKKKQQINRKKQIDAANKRNEEYLKEESEYYKKQDPNAKVFNRDGQEVADDGSIIVDDSPITGPVIEPAEGDMETDQFGNPVEEEDDYRYETNIKQEGSLRPEPELNLVEQAGKLAGTIFSIPDEIDKRVGVGEFNVYNLRQQLKKLFTLGLSEKYVIASLLGEILVPDSIDLAMLGVGYVPRRIWKTIKAGKEGMDTLRKYLKSRAAKKGLKLQSDGFMMERVSRATGRPFDELANESGLMMAIKTDNVEDWGQESLKRLKAGEKLTDDEMTAAYRAAMYDMPETKLKQGELDLKGVKAKDEPPLYNKKALERMNMTEEEAKLFSTELDFGKIPRDDKAALQSRLYGPAHFNNTKRYLFDKYLGYYARVKNNIITNGRIDKRFFDPKYKGIPLNTNLDPKNFKIESHHINPLASAMPLYDGATMTEIDKVVDILMKEGVMSGNNPLNLMAIPRSVHEVGHRYIDDFLKKDFGGTYFLKRYKTSAERYDAARKYAKIIKNSEKAILDAYFQHWLLFGKVIPDEILVSALQRVPLFSRYNLKTMQDIIREAGTDKKALEQITVLTRNDGKKVIRKGRTLSEKEAAMEDLKELYRQKRNLPKETQGRFKGSTFTSMRKEEADIDKQIDMIEKAYKMGKYKYLQRTIEGLKPEI